MNLPNTLLVPARYAFQLKWQLSIIGNLSVQSFALHILKAIHVINLMPTFSFL